MTQSSCSRRWACHSYPANSERTRASARFVMFVMTTVLITALMMLASSVHGDHDAAKRLPTWLVGCWISEDGPSIEAWVQDSDDVLIGFSSVVGDGAISFYEIMSIRLHDDGELTFTAYPSNQPGGSFAAVSQGDESVVFQNAEHDYPQRIRYQRSGDELLADIALADGSKQYDFAKTSCPRK